MTNTRANIFFYEDGKCAPCKNHQKKHIIDWTKRWFELEELANTYCGSNGNYYDCIITASGGKDCNCQAYIFKEKLKMNRIIVSFDTFSWTETGRKNWSNLLTAFGVSAYVMSLNSQI